MDKKYLFKKGKHGYKANLHCHTVVSDGTRTPEEIKKIYRDSGYSVVAFTDHNKLIPQTQLNDDSFLAINSVEFDINDEEHKNGSHSIRTYHFNLYAERCDMTETPPPPRMKYADIGAINAYIAERTAEGYLVCYNHPYWSLQDASEYCRLKGLFAMEIYNHSCETGGHYGYHPQAYDEMLRAGDMLYCVSADDNHDRHDPNGPMWDSCGGYVVINAESLTYENIIAALKNGNFYASQGPEIYGITLEDKKLSVECSPAQLINVYTDGRRCYPAYGDGMTGAAFELSGNERYIRVMCRDKNYKDANSNAYLTGFR